MDIEAVIRLVETIGFAGVIGGGAIWYTLKTSKEREARMWDTINGFQGVLTKFDGTLREISFGLRKVESDVETVKHDVADLKRKGD